MAETVDRSTWNDFRKMCAHAGCSCSTIRRSETEATDEKQKERKKRGVLYVFHQILFYHPNMNSYAYFHTIEVEL